MWRSECGAVITTAVRLPDSGSRDEGSGRNNSTDLHRNSSGKAAEEAAVHVDLQVTAVAETALAEIEPSRSVSER